MSRSLVADPRRATQVRATIVAHQQTLQRAQLRLRSAQACLDAVADRLCTAAAYPTTVHAAFLGETAGLLADASREAEAAATDLANAVARLTTTLRLVCGVLREPPR